MKQNQSKFTLYKIYYKDNTAGEDFIVYIGRTKQNLKSRLRGHFFKAKMHKAINIDLVTKIEIAYCKTEADMFLYEIYYINKLKPCINADDKAKDLLTVDLPDLEFSEFECNLMDKWKAQLSIKDKVTVSDDNGIWF